MSKAEIPYPPVFRDWRHPERRVATAQGVAGVRVETLLLGEGPPPSTWIGVELTENDASILAASLLLRAGHKNLSNRVLRMLDRKSVNAPGRGQQ